MKKIDLNQLKSVLIPLKLKTNSEWKKCIQIDLKLIWIVFFYLGFEINSNQF